jgi:hypothetical protein
MRKMWGIHQMALAAIMTFGLIVFLAGCGGYGESHDYNASAPRTNIPLRWERLESPGNYHTIIHACFGGDGIYLTQADNNSVTVVPNDPMCIAAIRETVTPSPQPNISPTS